MTPGALLQDISPFRRRPLTIPPNSPNAWLRLVVWEIWMGVLLCATIGGGIAFIRNAPAQIVIVHDLAPCYADPPAPPPCDRTLYRGLLNVAFSAFCGFFLLAGAGWLLWALWNAVEPKPITDDFLRLLHDSFGIDWRNPLTWPWARAFYAYGFTLVSATMMAGVALLIWTLVAPPARTPVMKIDTSETFRSTL